MTARLARLSLATAIAAGLLAPLAASAQGAAGGIQAFRVGILGGENEADRLMLELLEVAPVLPCRSPCLSRQAHSVHRHPPAHPAWN